MGNVRLDTKQELIFLQSRSIR